MLRRRYFSEYNNEGEVIYYGNIGNSSDIIIDFGKEIDIGGKYVFDYEASRYIPFGPLGNNLLVRFRMGSANDLIDCGLTTSGKSWAILIEGVTYSLGFQNDIVSGEHVIITLKRTGSEICSVTVEIGSKKTEIKNVSLSSFNAWSVFATNVAFAKIKVTRY